MPISRVRSVTETSMMFMITMPPTINEIEAIATVTTKKFWLMLDHKLMNVSFVSISKLSGVPGPSCRRVRRITRT